MKKNHSHACYRFFLRNSLLTPESIATKKLVLGQEEDEIFFQLTRVLRCQINDKVVLLNNSREKASPIEYIFQISTINKKNLVLELIDQVEKNNYQLPNPILAIGLPNKPAKLEFIIQKATELGVAQIHLIKFTFSQFPHQINLPRLDKIAIEAAEQSEQLCVPEIIFYQDLADYLSQQHKNSLLVALERSSQNSESLLSVNLPPQPILLIGPEGGISPQEKQILSEQGIKAFNLGSSILRMETACLLSLGICSLRLQKNQP